MRGKEVMTGVYLDDDGRLTYKVARKWRRITLGNVGQWRACPRCAAIVEGSWGQKAHIREHQENDELMERILNRTLGEPGENGYEWDDGDQDTGRDSASSGPDSGPDEELKASGQPDSGWRRFFK